jgi:acid phosphatase (class A)
MGVPEIRPGVLAGYLPPGTSVDSLALLPPPPAEASAAFEHDREVSHRAVAERGSPRWDLATRDADILFPAAASVFECALGVEISEETTPRLYTLLRRIVADAGLATYGAKNHYQRARPFMSNGEPTCTPQYDDYLRSDGSYPSGHTAAGWAWALILSEIDPAHANAILARGLEYGESRIYCNVHWHSDVVAGRTIGAAAVALLHDNEAFRVDLAVARREIAEARDRGLAPSIECEASGGSGHD